MRPPRPTARSPISAAEGSPAGRGRRRRRTDFDECGSGPLSAWFGLVVFLALLFVAVQILSNLYATSVLTSVSYDAARRVAASSGDTAAVAAAEADARHALGRYARRVSFDWSIDGEVVALRVRAHNPTAVLPATAGRLAFTDIDRTVRVRVERFR